MDIEVIGDDRFGDQAYKVLFEETMADLNKATLVNRVKMVLRPSIPLFVFSVVLKVEPGDKTIADASTVRTEGSGVHITITNERYAPQILSALWARYGRNSVDQQTRFDMDVSNAKIADMSKIVIASGEEDVREIMGAIWRLIPEGIKNRKTLISGDVITVVATEEILQPEMIEEGRKVHQSMGGLI